MTTLYQRLMLALAGSTGRQLRQENQFLRAQLDVLRARLPGPVRTTPPERARLVRLGRPLGHAVKEFLAIASFKTFTRWVRQSGRRPRRKRSLRRPGRPRTPLRTRNLILRLARETDWGYTRIQGELKKLGVSVGRGTVVNVLKQAGLPTAPDRAESPWYRFIAVHAQTLWACDFLSARVVTPKGIVDAFVLVFIHLATRRVHVSASTLHPDADWVARRAEAFARETAGVQPGSVVIHDRDTKLGGAFRRALAHEGVQAQRLPFRSPNLNAHAERFIQSLQNECLDRFIVMGTRHLDHLLTQYAVYHNTERPHSSLGFKTPQGPPLRLAGGGNASGPVRCRARLGGLLRHYYRAAG